MKSGGPSGAENGLSDFLGEARATRIAFGGVGEDAIAVLISARFKGEPEIIVTLGACWGERVEVSASGLRTSAVIVWLFSRSALSSWLPVRPVEPRRSTCILML